MAAPVNCDARIDISTRNVPKMSHKKFRAQLKKLRRKRIRQTLAKNRNEKSSGDDSDSEDAVESISFKNASLLATDELIREHEARERERLNREWLQREAAAQREFQIRKVKEEQMRQEREDKEREIREEWDALQKKEDAKKKRLEEEAQAKKDREAALLKEATQNTPKYEGPWCNPTAPADYGSELDKNNCPFYLKTGVCRFGEKCSRAHPRLPISRTILIPHMFDHIGMDKGHRDEFDSDLCLEYEDNERFQQFREFSDDVLPEFKKAGKVVQFKVCRNYERHLRGNVYVQFEKEEEAMSAFRMFNTRFYAGKQLSCEFTSIAKWKSAICGLDQFNRCPKGKNCNFLHVFNDQSNEFFDADRDLSPLRDSRRTYNVSSRQNSSRSSRQPRSPYSSRRSLRRTSSHERSSRRSFRESTRRRRHSRSRSSSLDRRRQKRHKQRQRSRSRFSDDDDDERTRERSRSRDRPPKMPNKRDITKIQIGHDEKTSTRNNGHSVDESSSSEISCKKSKKSKGKHKKSSSRRRRSSSSSSSSDADKKRGK